MKKRWWDYLLFWTTKRRRVLLDSELELELRVKNLQEDLLTQSRAHQRELEDHKHAIKLQQKEERLAFEREREKWLEDKERMIRLHEEDKEITLKRLKEELELSHKETITLLKLDSQQQIKQAELDRDRAIAKIQAESDNKLNEERRKLQEDQYKKLSTELAKLHSEGNSTTKFIQEMSLKMLEQTPGVRANVNLNQLPQPKDVD